MRTMRTKGNFMLAASFIVLTGVALALMNSSPTYAAESPRIQSFSPTSGPTSGGTLVVISGSRFQPGATVKVGGVASPSVNVVSSTQIKAVTPPHSKGTYGIRVTNPDGKSAWKRGFTYQVTTVVTPLTANAGSDLIGNEGSVITFSGSVTGGTAPYSYSWSFGDGASTSGTLAPAHAYADNGTYTVTLTVTDAQAATALDTAIVTVRNVAPTVNIGGPYNGTAGSPIAFSASATDPSSADTSAGFTYAWNFGDGGTRTGATPSHTYATANTYTVALTVTDKDGAAGSASTTAVISNTVTGTIYYVSTTGSDSNPGTQALPFKTIQKAANVVNPGDTVLVNDGTYTIPPVTPAACSSYHPVVCLTRGGTVDSFVTFKSMNKYGAKIDGQNNTSDTGFMFKSNANYIRIEGFEILGFGNNGSATGIELYSAGHDVQVVGNNIHDIGKLCTDTTNGQAGIFIQQNNVLVEQNLIHDIGRFAPGENGCSPTTNNYQNHDHGIYHDSGNDVTIRNNIIYNTKRGWGIQVYPAARTRLNILNNTFAFSNPYRDGHIIIYGVTLSNSNIQNNIFYQPTNAGIDFGGTLAITNTVIGNNITYGGTIANSSPSGVTFTNNQNNTNPLLVNPTAFDFHPQNGSPSIDAGVAVPGVTADFDGAPRPQGSAYDIGAYER